MENYRYKLFKFVLDANLKNDERTECIFRMLDQMPDIEVERLRLRKVDDKTVRKLTEKPMFKSKQDLFNILELGHFDALPQCEPYEYLSYVYVDNYFRNSLSDYCKQAGCVNISQLPNNF